VQVFITTTENITSSMHINTIEQSASFLNTPFPVAISRKTSKRIESRVSVQAEEKMISIAIASFRDKTNSSVGTSQICRSQPICITAYTVTDAHARVGKTAATIAISSYPKFFVSRNRVYVRKATRMTRSGTKIKVNTRIAGPRTSDGCA
jgi:hypothetical protein